MPKLFSQELSILGNRKFGRFCIYRFFAEMVSNFVGLDTVFGTYEIIYFHNFLDFENRAKNNIEKRKRNFVQK